MRCFKTTSRTWNHSPWSVAYSAATPECPGTHPQQRSFEGLHECLHKWGMTRSELNTACFKIWNSGWRPGQLEDELDCRIGGHLMDDLFDLYEWFTKFELRTIRFFWFRLPKRIGIPFTQYVLPFIFVALFHTLCVCVILKVLVRERWPELLVIGGGIGTAISVLSPEALARDHADLLQELLYLS